MSFDCFEAKVDCFFKSVGDFGSDDVVVLRYLHFDEGFFVHCGLGLNDFESYIQVCDVLVVTAEAFCLFVDERCEFFGDVKVDGFNSSFNNVLVFLVHVDVRVHNYVSIHGMLYVYISVLLRATDVRAIAARR